MAASRHIVLVNEFYHPDYCASAVVAADHMAKFAAARPDWRFTVIASRRAWVDPNLLYPEDEWIDRVRVIRVARPAVRRKSLLSRGIGFMVFERNATRAAARLGPIDLVIGTTAPPQGVRIAAKIARHAGCSYIYKALDLYPETAVSLKRISADSLIDRRWHKMDRQLMRGAAAVVTISRSMMERASASRDLPDELRHAIPDGFDDARLAFDGPNRFQERTVDRPDAFVVQYAGNMGLSHPFETILGAARRLEREDSILFQFIGDGPQRENIARALPSNARLYGYQPADQLGMILDTADVCLITQHHDLYDVALPYKFYAILAAGRPAIFLGHENSDIAVWLRNARCGHWLRQGDEEGLVESICRLRDDPAARAEMGRRARELYESTFRSTLAVRDWLELFDRLFDHPPICDL